MRPRVARFKLIPLPWGWPDPPNTELCVERAFLLALRLHPFKTQTCLLLALLGPCFETGRTNPILTGSVQVRLIGFITFNPQSRGFSHFPQGTCAIGLRVIFILRWETPPNSQCTTKHCYSHSHSFRSSTLSMGYHHFSRVFQPTYNAA